jgi:hypothetical protein
MLQELERSGSSIPEYPIELYGSWWHVTFFKDHPTLDGMASVYFNDKYKSGTIFYSDYLLNEYPDIYATWSKTNTNTVNANRMHMNKSLRGKSLGPISILYGAAILNHFGKILQHNDKVSKYGNDLWENAFNEIVNRKNENIDSIVLKDKYFEQPAQPSIFFYKHKVVLDD